MQTKPDWPSEEAYRQAAKSLGLEVAVLKAFAEVEAGPLGAFLDSGEPVILFERHLFSRFTGGKWDGRRCAGLPDKYSLLSAPTRTPKGGFGPNSVQHLKLAEATKLDRAAALRACSWGLFQILGDNWRLCGYPSLQAFINAMYESVERHLESVCGFIRNTSGLLPALLAKDWKRSAEIYNGPRQQGYDAKLSTAYEKWSAANG